MMPLWRQHGWTFRAGDGMVGANHRYKMPYLTVQDLKKPAKGWREFLVRLAREKEIKSIRISIRQQRQRRQQNPVTCTFIRYNMAP